MSSSSSTSEKVTDTDSTDDISFGSSLIDVGSSGSNINSAVVPSCSIAADSLASESSSSMSSSNAVISSISTASQQVSATDSTGTLSFGSWLKSSEIFPYGVSGSSFGKTSGGDIFGSCTWEGKGAESYGKSAPSVASNTNAPSTFPKLSRKKRKKMKSRKRKRNSHETQIFKNSPFDSVSIGGASAPISFKSSSSSDWNFPNISNNSGLFPHSVVSESSKPSESETNSCPSTDPSSVAGLSNNVPSLSLPRMRVTITALRRVDWEMRCVICGVKGAPLPDHFLNDACEDKCLKMLKKRWTDAPNVELLYYRALHQIGKLGFFRDDHVCVLCNVVHRSPAAKTAHKTSLTHQMSIAQFRSAHNWVCSQQVIPGRSSGALQCWICDWRVGARPRAHFDSAGHVEHVARDFERQ
eukprot:1004816_1